MNRSKLLRLLQIGMGGWGRSWAEEVVPKLPSVRTVGWVDADPNALETAQKTLKLPKKTGFTSLQNALTQLEVDAVLITASAVVHAPLAIEALNAGLHVLVEKPFALMLKDAEEVNKVARAQKRIIMVSQNYRFQPAPQLVAQLIKNQTLGQVGVVQVDFRRDNVHPSPDSPHLSWQQPLLLDMAIHHFDLMRFILGQDPLELYAQAWNPVWSLYRDPAAATVNIGFETGIEVSYRGSWVSPGQVTPWAGEWKLECEHGEISFSSRADNAPDVVKIKKLGKPARKLELPSLEHQDRLGSLNAFVQAIQTNTEPTTSGVDNIKSLQMSLEAIRSSQEHCVIGLRD